MIYFNYFDPVYREHFKLMGKITSYCKGGNYCVKLNTNFLIEDGIFCDDLLFDNIIKPVYPEEIICYGEAAEAIYG